MRRHRSTAHRVTDPVASLPPRNADVSHPVHRLQQSAGNHAVQRLLTGTPPIIQRQPTPGGGDAIGDPMTFIEAQLARQFIDPEDPRLYIRVQRLLDAAGQLTLPEAKGVLDRLKDRSPSDQLSKNFQRLATPSRNRLLGALRRRLPSDIEGKTLGAVYPGGPMTVGFPLVAAFEIVPSTEEAGTFGGYANAAVARQAAVRRPTISAVVHDRRMGLFRVFETGVPIVRYLPNPTVTARDTGPDFELTDWVNLEGPALPDPKDRLERMKAAQALRDDFARTYRSNLGTVGGAGQTSVDLQREAALKKGQEAYRALVEEAIPFARDQLQASMEIEVTDPSGDRRSMTTASPSMINIDPFAAYKQGFQAVLDPMTTVTGLPGASGRASMAAMFRDMPGIPYEPYLALSPSAVGEDPLQTLSVLVHEETHLAHARTAVALFEQWVGVGATPPFKDWVAAEVRARRLSAADAALAVEASEVSPTGWSVNTELIAEVESFAIAYHTALPQHREYFLDRLGKMGQRWPGSAPAVQELAVRKLKRYYERMLSQPARDAFNQYVVDRLVGGGLPAGGVDFFARLTEFAG